MAESMEPQIWAKTLWRTLTVLDSCQVFFFMSSGALVLAGAEALTGSNKEEETRRRGRSRKQVLITQYRANTECRPVFVCLPNALKCMMCVCACVYSDDYTTADTPSGDFAHLPQYLHIHTITCSPVSTVILIHKQDGSCVFFLGYALRTLALFLILPL